MIRRSLLIMVALLGSAALHLALLGLLADAVARPQTDGPLSVAVNDGRSLFAEAPAAAPDRRLDQPVQPVEPLLLSAKPPASVASVVLE